MKMKPSVLCVAIALCALFLAGCDEAAPETAPSRPASRASGNGQIMPQKLKQDLDTLFETIEKTHPNMYAYTPKAEFAQLRDDLYARVDHGMSANEFYRLVAPVVASLKNGHTNVLPRADQFQKSVKSGGKFHALTVDCSGNVPMLVGYSAPHRLPLGGELLSINGQDAAKLTKRYAACMGSERGSSNRTVLGRLLPVLLWMDYGAEQPLSLRIRTREGKVDTYSLPAVTLKEAQLLAVGRTGLGTKAYSYSYLEKDNAGLIVFNSFSNLEGWRAFLKSTFEDMHRRNASNLIVDIRENPGGDDRLGVELISYLTDEPFSQYAKCQMKVSPLWRRQQPEFVRKIERIMLQGRKANDGELISMDESHLRTHPGRTPLRFAGRVYLLIGPRSASSSVLLASALKHYGLATLIGQETEDLTSLYGHSLHFKLPDSGLPVSVACKYLVCIGSKEDGRGVIPHHEVRQTETDTAKAVDTTMQFALDLIRRGTGG